MTVLPDGEGGSLAISAVEDELALVLDGGRVCGPEGGELVVVPRGAGEVEGCFCGEGGIGGTVFVYVFKGELA